LGKLYLSLWARRLSSHAEDRLQDAQGGFRTKRATVDQGLTLSEALVRRRRQGKPSYLCFVDFRKAFDTIWHDGLYKTLWDEGVKGKAWRVVRSLYSSMHASVKLGTTVSREVHMRQGVRQGCPLSPVLFNFFINKLAKELATSGFGAKFEGVDLPALLYADDVVLCADSPEKLQKLIDILDKFCRRYHMEVNLSKSEVMKVGVKSVCESCRQAELSSLFVRAGCVLCSPWQCQGTRLKLVHKYKYLGLWFTSDMKWDEHISKAVAKAKKATRSIGKVLSNNKIPPRAKCLLWLARVRPKLTYGSEVWRTNAKQKKAMESVQTQAGVKIFKLNAKTNAHAVRALMNAPLIARRCEIARLKHYAKVMTMEKDRIARVLVNMPKRKGNPHFPQWRERMDGFINAKENKDIKTEIDKLRTSQARNQGILPHGIDPTVHDFNYEPIKTFKKKLKLWSKGKDLAELRAASTKERSTLKLLARATNAESETLPKYGATRTPNSGPNQIRLRLLSGTSALHSTLSRFTSTPRSDARSRTCPHAECDETEDATHFLLHCPVTADLRQEYTDSLASRCGCSRGISGGNDTGCSEFFAQLDPEGKALFMLGGPVDGRTPELSVDNAANHYMHQAWDRRSKRLNDTASDPLIVDVTSHRNQVVGSVYPSVASFFPSLSPNPCPSVANSNPSSTPVVQRTGSRCITHAHVSSPQSGVVMSNDARKRSGLDGQKARGRN
jgi:hypothetical protein